MSFPFRAGLPVQEDYARGLAAVVHGEVAHDGVAHQREPAGARRVRKRDRWTVEIGCRVAAPLALVAIVAGGPPVMRHRQIRGAIRNDPPAETPLDGFAGLDLAAGKPHGRQELAVRELRQALRRSAYANVLLDAVAPGRLELIVAVAIAFACPAESFSSNLSAANPHERLVRGESIRVLAIVDEELMAIFIAGVA